MSRPDIRAVGWEDLPQVAEFLHGWHDRTSPDASGGALRKDADSILRCLTWLLIRNPVRSPDSGHFGFHVRDADGVLKGVSLNFPAEFVAGDRRIRGLCSGSFFVDPDVRSAGFYLFRRYLAVPDYSFFFATTCNAQSSALWKGLGGQAGPGSQYEYILPVRSEVILEAALHAESRSGIVSSTARAIGRCTNALPRFRERGDSLRVEACRDWEKLAALASRHRPTELVTSNRTAAFLEWRYGPGSPNQEADVCVFSDGAGREGWFALGNRRLGRHGQIAASLVLDLVWSGEEIAFGAVLSAIYRRAAPEADAIYLAPSGRVDYRESSRWVLRRRLEAPRVWMMVPDGGAAIDSSVLDLVMADGDSGWSNRYENESLPVGSIWEA